MNNVIRINITMSRQLLKELEAEVAPRGKSGFVSEAVEEMLRRRRREKALVELSKLPPVFNNIKDGAEYISKMRRREDKIRTRRLAA